MAASFGVGADLAGFVSANASYVHLYNALLGLQQSRDPAGAAVLRDRFFGADADEPVQLDTPGVHVADALRSVMDAGAALPDTLLAKLLALATKKLELLVAAYHQGTLRLSVLIGGTLVQHVSVSRECTVHQLLQVLARKSGRDLSGHGLFRRSMGPSHRRGTLVLADQALDATATLSQAQVLEDELLMCAPLQPAALCMQRVRVMVPYRNVAVEVAAPEGVTCASLVSLVLSADGSLAGHEPGLLVLLEPSHATHREWTLLDPHRSLASYHIKPSEHYLFCCQLSDWEAGAAGSRAWLSLIVDWSRLRAQRSDVLKLKLRGGLPAWTRECVWALTMNAFAARAEQPGLYASLVVETPASHASGRWQSDRDVVFRDLSRTFPDHPFFAASGPGIKSLQNVLLAWHSLEPRIGYCQGINFIAAVFLLHMDEELAFWSLHSLLTVRGLENLYRSGLPLLKTALDVFQQLIERQLPQLAAFFAVQDVPVSSFASPWFHTLFAWRFPLALVVRVFDVFLVEGFCIVYRLALALLREHQSELLACDAGEVFLYLQDVDKLLRGLSADEWMTRALRVKKTPVMNITSSQVASFSGTARPTSAPIANMANRVGTMLRQLSFRPGRSGTIGSSSRPELDPTEGTAAPAPVSPPPPSLLRKLSPRGDFSPRGGGDSADGDVWTLPDEGNLWMDANGEVAAATPEKLVEILTAPRFPGQLFTDAFLLTFRTFLAPLRLLELLQSRLEHMPRPGPKMSAADYALEVAQPLRLRVFTCLRLWVSTYPRDFDDALLMPVVDAILKLFREANMDNYADRLAHLLASRPAPLRPMHPVASQLARVSLVTLPASPSALPMPASLLKLDQVSPQVLAKLLCQVDARAYASCQPHHLLEAGPSVVSIQRWNVKCRSWVEGCIVHEAQSLDALVKRFQFFVETADACLSMNNVSGMVVIAEALRFVLRYGLGACLFVCLCFSLNFSRLQLLSSRSGVAQTMFAQRAAPVGPSGAHSGERHGLHGRGTFFPRPFSWWPGGCAVDLVLCHCGAHYLDGDAGHGGYRPHTRRSRQLSEAPAAVADCRRLPAVPKD